MCSAQELRYSVDSQSAWVPYSNSSDKTYPGIFRELSELILVHAGIKPIPVDVPTKRAIKLLQAGQIDFDWVNPGWFPDGDVGKDLIVSDPIFTMTEWVVTLPEHKDKFSELADIHDQVIGTIRGFYYFDDAEFVRMDFSSEEALVKGLIINRFEAAILEEMTAVYWASKLDVELSFAVVHTSGNMVWRIHQKNAHLLPKINAAIAKLRSKGKIESIFKRYRNAFLQP